MQRLVAHLRRFVDERQGQPSDLDDWAAVLAEFDNGATGVLESSKLASGRNESWRSQDYVEVNGSERSYVFFTERWNELLAGRAGGGGLERVMIPRNFFKRPGAPRDPNQGDPLVTFRYDQAHEFIDAIRAQRSCTPSFHDGARAQLVTDAAVRSAAERRWIDLKEFASV
jgi:predicted dehydrogenase